MSDGRKPGDGELVLGVPEMDCPSCAGKVESALSGLDEVDEVDLRPTSGIVVVRAGGSGGELDSPELDPRDVMAAVERAGYGVETVSGTGRFEGVEESGRLEGFGEGGRDEDLEATSLSDVWRSTRAKKTAVSGLFLALGVVVTWLFPGIDGQVASVLGQPLTLADALLLVGIVAGGEVILRNGYYSARQRSLDIHFLMSIAIVAAVVASPFMAGKNLYVEAAALAFLFNVAELLERYSVDRARASIRELLELAPDTAVVRRDGERREVHVEEVEVGDVVIVEPGGKIPVDGEVIEGASAVDESPITGESLPRDKTPGEEVYAGSVNEEGYLEVEATSRGGDTTLSRIIELVEGAEAERTEREQFVDRFAGYYTPAVVLFAIGVATGPPLLAGQAWSTWFVRGIALLVIACPCAFVISTPVSVVSAVTSAAKRGVLVKGGRYLESMGEVDAVAFDKTGTLTKGELAVTDVVPLGENTEEDVLRCARGVERRSEHPIGRAIVEHAAVAGGAGGGDAREVAGFESLTGKGVRADLDGSTHYAGKPELFENLGFDLGHVHVTEPDGDLTRPSGSASAGSVREFSAEVRNACERDGCLDLLEDTIPRLRAEGKTVVLVGRVAADRPGEVPGELEGVIAVADEIRPGARAMLTRLRELGVEPVMLTGDSEATARAVAEDLGIEEYRAGLLPEDKVEAVERLSEEYGSVAMVGDGINDAPALATANVGIAMGAAGTDAAIETADVALMGDDLSKLPYLLGLSRRANRVIRQNIWASLGVKAALAAAIPLGYVSVVVAVLAGDVGMTVAVTANALRLSRITP